MIIILLNNFRELASENKNDSKTEKKKDKMLHKLKKTF